MAGAAEAATPPPGAFIYVGNVDDGSRSGVVDKRTFVKPVKTGSVSTALDSGEDMAIGDVVGDAFDEVVVADDGTGASTCTTRAPTRRRRSAPRSAST